MSKSFSEYRKSLAESQEIVQEAFGELPPNILVLKRQSVRHFPDNTLVALYHNQKLNQFFSVPFGGAIRSTITPATVKEEAEQLDELNSPTLGSYLQKRREEYRTRDAHQEKHNLPLGQGGHKRLQTYKGVSRATHKLFLRTGDPDRKVAHAAKDALNMDESVLLEVNLSDKDHEVIKSFMNKKPHSSKKLSTDGKRLDGNWLGGSGIAHHSEHGLHLNELGSKSGQQVHRAIKKHNSLDSHSDVPHHTIIHEEVIDEMTTLNTQQWEVHKNGKPTGTIETNFSYAKKYWAHRTNSNPHGHKFSLVPKKTEKFSGTKDFQLHGHLDEGVIVENAIEQLKHIKAFKATHIHHNDKKKTRLDPTTASALLTVHDALSPDNQRKFREHLEHSGPKLKKMVDFAWKSVK